MGRFIQNSSRRFPDRGFDRFGEPGQYGARSVSDWKIKIESKPKL
jgi:hypothetical protein